MNKKSYIKELSVAVDLEFTGIRLDKFLSDCFAEHSRSRIKALILAGHVSSRKLKITDPSYRVKSGECYLINLPPVIKAKPVGQKIKLQIVYEDDDLIIVDKPPGIVVHPAAGNPDNTLVNALIAHCGTSLSGIGGEMRPGIVHRLDKDTSGLIVAAKNDITHRGLAKQFADHTVDRAYKAIVWGVPKTEFGSIRGYIGRNTRNRKKMTVVKRDGKHAITHYRVEKKMGIIDPLLASLVECRLETGRTHQIRVHLSSIGHPIIGDPLYGSKAQKKLSGIVNVEFNEAVCSLKRQALHAYKLGFEHPIKAVRILFKSELPRDIKTCFKL